MSWIKITNNVTQYDSDTLLAFMNEVVDLYELARQEYDQMQVRRGQPPTAPWRRASPTEIEVFNFPSASSERPVKLPEVRAHQRTRLSLGTVGAVTGATPMSQLVAGISDRSSLPYRFYEQLASRALQLVGVQSRWHNIPILLNVPDGETRERIQTAQRKKNLYVEYSTSKKTNIKEVRTLKKKADAVAKATNSTRWQKHCDERFTETVSTRVHDVIRHVVNLSLLPKVGEKVSDEMLSVTRETKDVLMECRNKLQTAIDKINELEGELESNQGGE